MLHEGIAGSELCVVDGAGHTLCWTHPGELAELISGA
jgi:pimeloyl-ACP methyl ester carboxylesterase